MKNQRPSSARIIPIMKVAMLMPAAPPFETPDVVPFVIGEPVEVLNLVVLEEVILLLDSDNEVVVADDDPDPEIPVPAKPAD